MAAHEEPTSISGCDGAEDSPVFRSRVVGRTTTSILVTPVRRNTARSPSASTFRNRTIVRKRVGGNGREGEMRGHNMPGENFREVACADGDAEDMTREIIERVFNEDYPPQQPRFAERVYKTDGDSLRDCKTEGDADAPRTSKKQKRASNQVVDVFHSFAALEGIGVHTLILGTMPSIKSFGRNLSRKEILLRGGDGPQNYGHSRNSFWNIAGSALGFCRHQTPFAEQVQMLTREGYALWDVLSEAKRAGSSDSNLVRGSFVPNDLPGFLLDHPQLNRLVFAANSAQIFAKQGVWDGWLATGTATATNGRPLHTKFWIRARPMNLFGKKTAVEIVNDEDLCDRYGQTRVIQDADGTLLRVVELVVLPSTSPANALARPPEKEKKWHAACYRLREPPLHYRCPGCEHRQSTARRCKKEEPNNPKHWFQDCPHREDWKTFKKAQKKSSKDNQIDPFDWYT